MVHMASLIHDDIIDGSELRRGRKTLYRRFGTQAAVLAGDRLLPQLSSFSLARDARVSQVIHR